jgi:hypothetical protein
MEILLYADAVYRAGQHALLYIYTHVQDIIVVRLLARRREEIIRIYVCLHARGTMVRCFSNPTEETYPEDCMPCATYQDSLVLGRVLYTWWWAAAVTRVCS